MVFRRLSKPLDGFFGLLTQHLSPGIIYWMVIERTRFEKGGQERQMGWRIMPVKMLAKNRRHGLPPLLAENGALPLS
jgi:hypothetical protein